MERVVRHIGELPSPCIVGEAASTEERHERFGYAGKILHVDLTTGTLKIEEPPEERYRTYLGGSALGLY
jgi:hypothetical protein